MASHRSGTSRSYSDRKAKGRPNVTYSLPQETADAIAELAESDGVSRSEIVVRLVDAELRRRKKRH